MPLALLVALTVALGFVTGVLSGMFGIGGATVSTPGIRALGATAYQGVGTTLPSILPGALVGTLRYRREGLVRWRPVGITAASGLAAAVGGSLLSHAVPGHGHLLMIATAALVAYTGARMILAARSTAAETGETAAGEADPIALDGVHPVATRAVLVPWRFAVTGVLAGGLNGLLGVGGGIVMVPAFAEWIGLDLKEAVATSLACVGILAVPSTVTHAFLGDIDWTFALALCVGVVPGARLGAHLAIRSSDRALRTVIGLGLALVAVVYAAGELIALVH